MYDQIGRQRRNRLELIAERDPRERQGRKNKPGAKLHPFPRSAGSGPDCGDPIDGSGR
jgi:hypothetical protein